MRNEPFFLRPPVNVLTSRCQNRAMPKISIIATCFNAEAVWPKFLERKGVIAGPAGLISMAFSRMVFHASLLEYC